MYLCIKIIKQLVVDFFISIIIIIVIYTSGNSNCSYGIVHNSYNITGGDVSSCDLVDGGLILTGNGGPENNIGS